MCGHVSLLCLCLLFVSSSVQGGQENLPSTWTRIVREAAQVQLTEGLEKTLQTFAEQLSNCNSRALVLQKMLDEEKTAMEEKLRLKSEELTNVNSRRLVLEARLDEKKEGVEQIRQVYAEQLGHLNSRLDEAQKTIETVRIDNLRLKQQLEEFTTNFDGLERQLAVTTGDLKTKTSELTRCDVESTTLREKVKLTTENIEVMNEEMKNQTSDLQQYITEVILNAKNTIVKQVVDSKIEISNKCTGDLVQEITSTKSKLDAGYNEIQSKQNQILQEIASSTSKIDAGFNKMTQERESKYNGLQNQQRDILQVVEATRIQAKRAAKNNYIYFSKEHKLSWHDAQKQCRSMGQKLVTIESVLENQIIFNRMNDLEMTHTWIGATDESVEGTWRWIGTNQTLTYKNWARGEPSGGWKNNCAFIFSDDGKWYSYDCEDENSYICEL